MPNLNYSDAAHLLRRTGFGGRPAEIDALIGLSREAAVDRVLDVSAAPPAYRPAGIDTAPSEYAGWHLALYWWFDRMTTTTAPLQEKMALFWHGHFACSDVKVQSWSAMFDQNQIFRTFGLGSFRDLAFNVSVSPAMLIYLDNVSNVVGSPQENFGRELMELHTIGVGNFTEADVVAMTRAWTGHGQVGWNGTNWDYSYRFRPEQHDAGQKSLFGITRAWNGPETIDELVLGAKRTACARFITRKLYRHFVAPSPSDAVVNALATVFSDGGMNITTLLRAMFLHDDFWAAQHRFSLVRSPVEFVVNVIRATGLRLDDAGLHFVLYGMGQVPFYPPDVNGWPSQEGWLTTSSLWSRASFLQFVQWGTSGNGWWSDIQSLGPVAAVDKMLTDLGIRDASASSVSLLQTWFTDLVNREAWAAPADALLVGCMIPEFQLG